MTQQSAHDFLAYCDKHIKGDEKGEAQIFLDHLFTALGYADGLKGAGADCEVRIKKGKEAKTTSFADLVWKPRVLLEMKKRGTDLALHYQQAYEYWRHLVPDPPQYVVLCNFDEFWVYNFLKQAYEPLDKISLPELWEQRAALAFLLPKPQEPVFRANRTNVTELAADKIAALFRSLVQFPKRGIGRDEALRYCMQCVVAMFASSVGLLPDNLFTRLVRECADQKANSYDLLGGLFQAMNTPGITPAGRYQGVPYFNGGLFDKILPQELNEREIDLLDFAADKDWRAVNPAIFGTIFEHGLDKAERHVLGAHYTHETDILKVVGPVLVSPWRRRIEAADTAEALYDTLRALRRYRVLDPACGSGNFLFVAFKEMKLLERSLLARLRAVSTAPADRQALADFIRTEPAVSTHQFYGLDVKPFAVELAKVTLMIAKELTVLDATEGDDQQAALPLDNLDANIVCADALLLPDGQPQPWPAVEVIIGNPPYQSKNKMQQEFGAAYMNQLRAAYPAISGKADFCVYWFRKAHEALPADAYAGLVATNTVRQNQSRESSLDYIVAHGGTITDAISSQKWSGEAVLHVSIVSWKKGAEAGDKRLCVANERGELVCHLVPHISSSLSLEADVSTAAVLQTQRNSTVCFQGQTHGHEGFLLNHYDGQQLLTEDARNAEVVRPFLIANDLLGVIGAQPKRFVVDFTLLDVMQAGSYKKPFALVQKKVLPDRETRGQEQKAVNAALLAANPKAKTNKHHLNFLNNWWKLSYGREDMLKALVPLTRYVACSRVAKRNIFEFVSTTIRPNDALMVFALDDYYSFGILHSAAHWQWWQAKGSTLKDDARYTTDTVWDTFPWPQQPAKAQVRAVAAAARQLHEQRTRLLADYRLSLRELYRTMEQPGKNPLATCTTRLIKPWPPPTACRRASLGCRTCWP